MTNDTPQTSGGEGFDAWAEPLEHAPATELTQKDLDDLATIAGGEHAEADPELEERFSAIPLDDLRLATSFGFAPAAFSQITPEGEMVTGDFVQLSMESRRNDPERPDADTRAVIIPADVFETFLEAGFAVLLRLKQAEAMRNAQAEEESK